MRSGSSQSRSRSGRRERGGRRAQRDRHASRGRTRPNTARSSDFREHRHELRPSRHYQSVGDSSRRGGNRSDPSSTRRRRHPTASSRRHTVRSRRSESSEDDENRGRSRRTEDRRSDRKRRVSTRKPTTDKPLRPRKKISSVKPKVRTARLSHSNRAVPSRTSDVTGSGKGGGKRIALGKQSYFTSKPTTGEKGKSAPKGGYQSNRGKAGASDIQPGKSAPPQKWPKKWEWNYTTHEWNITAAWKQMEEEEKAKLAGPVFSTVAKTGADPYVAKAAKAKNAAMTLLSSQEPPPPASDPRVAAAHAGRSYPKTYDASGKEVPLPKTNTSAKAKTAGMIPPPKGRAPLLLPVKPTKRLSSGSEIKNYHVCVSG